MPIFSSAEGRRDQCKIEEILDHLPLPDLQRLLDSVRLKISSAEIDMNPAQSLGILETRFFGPKGLDREVEWKRVESSLLADLEALQALNYLEKTGGMPNVFKYDHTGFWLADCSPEVPLKRRYLAYDEKAEKWWQEESEKWWSIVKAREDLMDIICLGRAVPEEAQKLGLELMNPELYHYFQTLGRFDRHSATWLKTETGKLPLIGRRSDDQVMISPQYPHVTSLRLGARYVKNVMWAI